VNFTFIKERMHPYSALIEREVLYDIVKGIEVLFDFPEISIGRKKLVFEKIIPPVEKKSKNPDYISNINLLNRYLQKFGRFEDMSVLSDFSLKDYFRDNKLSALDFRSFFGKGEGLTPAFDDFFSGMLFADRFCQNNLIETGEKFFRFLKDKTTLTSYWQVRSADKGRMSFVFEEALIRILSEKIFLSDVLRCIGIGHTSGSFILKGLESYFTEIEGKAVLCT